MKLINKSGSGINNYENNIPNEIKNQTNIFSENLNKIITDLGVNNLLRIFLDLYRFIKEEQNHKKIAEILCKEIENKKILEILSNPLIDSNIKLGILEEIENKKLFEIDENLLNELNKSNTLELKKAGKITFIYSNHYKKSFVLFNGKKQIIEGNLFFNEKENYYYSIKTSVIVSGKGGNPIFSKETIKYNEFGEEKN